jgi:hypothetical protein
MFSHSIPPISYPCNLTDKVISMRKEIDNKSLGRMLLANSYSNDNILMKNGYNPDELRKKFSDLYKNDIFTEFSSDFFYDIHDYRQKKKNNLEKILLKEFESIPKGYISNIEETTEKFEYTHSDYYEDISVIFILNTTEKIKFVKAVISVYEFDEFNIYQRLFEKVRFEEITGREAIDSIPGIGHIIGEYELGLIIKSL